MLLLLLDGLQRYVLPLGPVDHTAEEQETPGSTSDLLVRTESWRVRPYTDPLSVHTQDTSPSASPFISVPIPRSIQAPHYWTNNPQPSQDRKSEGGRRGGGRPPGIQEGDRMMYHGITRLFSALKDMEQL